MAQKEVKVEADAQMPSKMYCENEAWVEICGARAGDKSDEDENDDHTPRGWRGRISIRARPAKHLLLLVHSSKAMHGD